MCLFKAQIVYNHLELLQNGTQNFEARLNLRKIKFLKQKDVLSVKNESTEVCETEKSI